MDGEPRRLPRHKLYLFTGCAIVVLTVVVCAGRLPGLGVKLLGPPSVTMREAYARSPKGPTVNHDVLDGLLNAYVDADGWVNYAALREDRASLESYIGSLKDVPFEKLGRDEKLALLINAYNAFTLQLIVERHPIDSIRDIPSRDRWDAVRWNVGDHTWSLNQIEHEQIRAKFAEPRVHFALVCASVSCPPLRREAYRAEKLERQLHEQCVYAHTHDRWCVFDKEKGEIRLTKLYEWYGGDFEQSHGSVLAFAAQYLPALQDARKRGKEPRVRWLPYDWSLNDQARRP